MSVYEWTKNEYAKRMNDKDNIPIINYRYTITEKRKIKKQAGTKPVCYFFHLIRTLKERIIK